MKRQGNNHRWTNEEMASLIRMWGDNIPQVEIAQTFGVSTPALNKVVTRMRNAGVPLQYRQKGHQAGRVNKLWSQSEVEYLLRRRSERISVNQIAAEMNRTPYGVNGMILRLRSEGVQVTMLGQGVKKLWNPDMLKALVGDTTSPLNRANIN